MNFNMNMKKWREGVSDYGSRMKKAAATKIETYKQNKMAKSSFKGPGGKDRWDEGLEDYQQD